MPGSPQASRSPLEPPAHIGNQNQPLTWLQAVVCMPYYQVTHVRFHVEAHLDGAPSAVLLQLPVQGVFLVRAPPDMHRTAASRLAARLVQCAPPARCWSADAGGKLAGLGVGSSAPTPQHDSVHVLPHLFAAAVCAEEHLHVG